MPAHLERARLLLATHRAAEAEREARAGLGEEPQSRELLHALCSALVEQEKWPEARATAQSLVALAPNWPDSFYMTTCVELEGKRYKLAEKAALEALRLAPNLVISHQNLAVCYMRQEFWGDALREAEAGLALDPENSGCANIRSFALNHFGRKIESMHSADSALRSNPENSRTHYTAGIVKLENGEPRQALEHFTEALRLDPNNELARKGLVEAMKAHNSLYRALLAYSFWMMRLSAGQRRAVIIAGVLGYNFVKNDSGLGMWASLICVVYFSFVMLTWVGSSFFDFLLLFDRRTRHALESRQRAGAVALVCCLVISALWFVVGVAGSVVDPFWALPILLYAIPLTRVFKNRDGWRRVTSYVVTVSLGLLLLGSLCLVATQTDQVLVLITLILLVIYMWVGRLLDI